MFDLCRCVFGALLVVLAVDEARAVAPGDVPVQQQDAKLLASHFDAQDRFGGALAISGDTLLVGSASAGPGDVEGPGRVDVLVNSAGSWTQQAILLSPDGALGEQFGYSVAIEGDTALVGAWGDNYGSLFATGAAYVFVRTGTAWQFAQKLIAPEPETGMSFGYSVSLSGDTALIGCPQDNLSFDWAGSAYVFVRSDGLWSQQALLVADDTAFNRRFGFAVDLSGDTAVVGEPGYDVEPGFDLGAAYVFVRSGTTWVQQAQLLTSWGATGDELGFSVALEDDTLVVGAPGANFLGFGDAGAAHVFQRNGGVWSEQAVLHDPEPDFGDTFGTTVSLWDDLIVVGTPHDDKASMDDPGSAFVFRRNVASWIPIAELEASDPRPFDHLGFGIAVSGELAFAGAPYANSPTLVIDIGATYAFDLADLADAWVDLGFGLAGAGGVPGLVGNGTPVAGSPGSLSLAGANPSALAILFISLSSTPAPFKGGTLVPLPIVIGQVLVTNGSGAKLLSWSAWPGGLPAGAALYFQYAIHDDGGPFGVALSNALRATTP